MAPENTELAAAIQTGFEQVIADGSYQRLVEETIMTPWLGVSSNFGREGFLCFRILRRLMCWLM